MYYFVDCRASADTYCGWSEPFYHRRRSIKLRLCFFQMTETSESQYSWQLARCHFSVYSMRFPEYQFILNLLLCLAVQPRPKSMFPQQSRSKTQEVQGSSVSEALSHLSYSKSFNVSESNKSSEENFLRTKVSYFVLLRWTVQLMQRWVGVVNCLSTIFMQVPVRNGCSLARHMGTSIVM